jgi:hypothetical protein
LDASIISGVATWHLFMQVFCRVAGMIAHTLGSCQRKNCESASNMQLTAEQCKAARALLGWTR